MGHQNWSGCFGKDKNILPLPGLEPPTPSRPQPSHYTGHAMHHNCATFQCAVDTGHLLLSRYEKVRGYQWLGTTAGTKNAPLRYALFWVITQRTVGNSLRTFRYNLSGPIFVDFLTLEDGGDRLSRNVGN